MKLVGPLLGRGNCFANQQWPRTPSTTKWELSRIGKPVDKTEWGMTPQTVNAYYNPLQNRLVFPAAILQPPFFDPSATPR
ncbi:MAG: M13-type metalloendopeptidase [Thermoanaerobaculia bacterium]